MRTLRSTSTRLIRGKGVIGSRINRTSPRFRRSTSSLRCCSSQVRDRERRLRSRSSRSGADLHLFETGRDRFGRALAEFRRRNDGRAVPTGGRSAPEYQLIAMRTTYFIGRETILATRKLGLSRWRRSLFAWMTRNAGDVTSYFCLPPNAVVELGARVEV